MSGADRDEAQEVTNRGGRRHRLTAASFVAVASLLAAVIVPWSALGSEPEVLQFSPPTLIDNQQPFPVVDPLHSVSCPTTTLCVAVDDEGRAVVGSSTAVTTTSTTTTTTTTTTSTTSSTSSTVTTTTTATSTTTATTSTTSSSTSTTPTTTTTTSTTTTTTTSTPSTTTTTTTTPSTTTTTTSSTASTTTASTSTTAIPTTTTTSAATTSNPPAETGAPKVNHKTGEIQAEYEFPEAGEAEAYGEVAGGASVARVHSAGYLAPQLSLFVSPLTASEADFLGAPEATQAKTKKGKCRTGYVKKRKKCVSTAPIKFGLVKLAIPSAGTYKIDIKPSVRVLKELKKGKRLEVQLTVVFTPAGTTTQLTKVSSVGVHVKGR
jgi:hypothetical protein